MRKIPKLQTLSNIKLILTKKGLYRLTQNKTAITELEIIINYHNRIPKIKNPKMGISHSSPHKDPRKFNVLYTHLYITKNNR